MVRFVAFAIICVSVCDWECWLMQRWTEAESEEGSRAGSELDLVSWRWVCATNEKVQPRVASYLRWAVDWTSQRVGSCGTARGMQCSNDGKKRDRK